MSYSAKQNGDFPVTKALRDRVGLYTMKTYLGIYERQLALDQFFRAATKLQGTGMQIEKALINGHLRVSKVS